MRILLLGANGQLGRTFIKGGGLASRGDLIVASRDGVLTDNGYGEIADLSSPVSLNALLGRVQPDVIVNAAAYTAVDRAEQEPEMAYRVNGESVGVLGRWAAANAAKVIHYSTDYVFDGKASEPYGVDATPAPLGVYGHSKLAGELALQESGASHLILRTAWVYAALGQNFLRTMLRLGEERDELRVVVDQYGAPTDTSLIVNGSLAALDHWSDSAKAKVAGTYHLVASGRTTWHGFAEAIFDRAALLGLVRNKPKIIPISASDFPTAAARPRWSVMENARFEQDFGFNLPRWQNGLLAVMDQIVNTGQTKIC
jgi:dTDP-4-dehydrorhamnose reductase